MFLVFPVPGVQILVTISGSTMVTVTVAGKMDGLASVLTGSGTLRGARTLDGSIRYLDQLVDLHWTAQGRTGQPDTGRMGPGPLSPLIRSGTVHRHLLPG